MSPRILVAAENGHSLTSLQRSVSKVGGKLFGCAPALMATCDAQEALQCVLSEGPMDLVLLDLKLQGTNGLEAARQMRARFTPTELPIVGLVAQGSSTGGLDSVDKLFNEVVQKPLSSLSLNKLLKRHARCLQSPASLSESHGFQSADASLLGSATYSTPDGPSTSSGFVPDTDVPLFFPGSGVLGGVEASGGSGTSTGGLSDSGLPRVSIKVLIAEDSMANQMVIKRAVRKVTRRIWGVEPEIEAVTDGAQAVSAAMSRQFDIVLMDIYMPVMTGLLAARDIRKRFSMDELPIIALTAAGDGELEQMANSGFNEVASKNMSSDMLFSLLERYIMKPRPGVHAFSESVLADSMGNISFQKFSQQ